LSAAFLRAEPASDEDEIVLMQVGERHALQRDRVRTVISDHDIAADLNRGAMWMATSATASKPMPPAIFTLTDLEAILMTAAKSPSS
jgi:hypothetical protein